MHWIITKGGGETVLQEAVETPKRRTRTTKQVAGTRDQPLFSRAEVTRLSEDSRVSKSRRGPGAVRKQRQRELEAELEERRVSRLATGESVHFVVGDEAASRTLGAGDGQVTKTRASFADVFFAPARRA